VARPTLLITGSTDGIGLALANRFAHAGWRVIRHGRRLTPWPDLIQADLADPQAPDQIASGLDRLGVPTLDVIVHNAALGHYGPLAALSPEGIDQLLTVNLWAPIALTHRLLPRLAPGGKLVFVSSIASSLPNRDYSLYTATKAGLDAFARNLRLELAERAQVLTLWPSATATQLQTKCGVPADAQARMRFAPVATVAAAMEAAIHAGRSTAIGASTALLRWVGLHAEGLVATPPVAPAPRPAGRVYITGGADGIGRALALALGRSWPVVIVDCDQARAEATAGDVHHQGGCATVLVADLLVPAAVAQLAHSVSDDTGLAGLVLNAGINHTGPFSTSRLAAQRQVFDLNLRAPVHLIAAALRRGLARGGHLVALSSLSRFVSYPGAAVYAATKDALALIVRSLRPSLAPAGVNTLVVYPGPTRTAHARRYSPNHSREAWRMPPEVVAAHTIAALQARRPSVIPGLTNQLFAAAGVWLPDLVEAHMVRSLYRALSAPLAPRDPAP
jgi:hypothetical protein